MRRATPWARSTPRSEEHTSELQSRRELVCRLLLEKKKKAYPLQLYRCFYGLIQPWRGQSISTKFHFSFSFFFTNPPTTEIYPLSLHDALPILTRTARQPSRRSRACSPYRSGACAPDRQDRKSTRLNSSHVEISYAVFCLK